VAGEAGFHAGGGLFSPIETTIPTYPLTNDNSIDYNL
jgi:hypothetical protein